MAPLNTLERSDVAGKPHQPSSMPPERDLLNRANFGLLPEPEGRLGSFGVAAVINVVFASLVVLFMLAKIHEDIKQHQFDNTQLIFPVAVPKPPPPPLPRIKVLARPPVVPPKIQLPRQIEAPRPQPAPPKVELAKVAPMPNVPAARPKAVVAPPQPKVGVFASNNPTPVANNKTAPSVKTGGFGNPVGVVPNPSATKAGTIASIGSFDNAPGPGQGAGAARRGSVQGTSFGSGVANGAPGGTARGAVASSGFGTGMVGGRPGGAAHGTVASTGFGSTPPAPAGPAVVKQPAAVTTGVVLTSKPRPEYTAEAKQLRIEGQVTLQVRFTAGGQVDVMRVVSGLGHGLDEEAKRAAQQIRFKPALKNGQPVDQISNVTITFQLA